MLENLHSVQTSAGVPLSKSLSKIDGLGAVNLDIEMETGTGKTYVYIKTMFELNKLYGWSKFIIVVPSIAIREGVAKSFRMLEEHFMEQYGKKTRWFVYNSSTLNQLDQFSQDAGLNAMIINTQASRIMIYLEDNGYVDDSGNITPKYHADLAAEALVPYGEKLALLADGITLLINSIFDPSLLDSMTENGAKTKFPVKILVADNRALAFVKWEMELAGLTPSETNLVNPDFAEVATAIGFQAETVTKPEDLEEAMKRWLSSEGPALLSVTSDTDAASFSFSKELMEKAAPGNVVSNFMVPGV